MPRVTSFFQEKIDGYQPYVIPKLIPYPSCIELKRFNSQRIGRSIGISFLFILKQGITSLLNYDSQSHGLMISRVGWSKLQSKEPHMTIKPETT
jgi:hypothetical protein